jgi:hypothetical protein
VLEADDGHCKKVSVIGGVSVSPATRLLAFHFATEPDGFYAAAKVVEWDRSKLPFPTREIQ